MPDNKKLTGKPDRIRVSAKEDYEVRHVAQEFDLPSSVVAEVIAKEGPMRKDVEAGLRKMKART